VPSSAAGLVLILALLGIQDRAPEPDAATLKESLKLLRDLFKEDYAKKPAVDQRALAQKLMAKGLATVDDRNARYAFFVEARDVASACGDVETAVRAVDDLAREFQVDGQAMKSATLSKMAGSAKDPETARLLARALLGMVPEAIRAESFDAAAGAAQKAEGLAKIAQDPPIASRAAEMKAEVASLKAEATRVRPLIEKPGPGDEETIGRYLCFVRGDWASGLPHLLAGAKPPLKPVVEKDVLNPAEADKQLEVAEAWIEFGQKEKSSWRRSRIQLRARFWLEKAGTSATGLVRMKVEKRLGEIEENEPGAVNLLRLIDPKQDGLDGEWAFEGGALVSPAVPWARLQIPYTPPDEYELTVIAERKAGNNSLGIGLVRGTTPFALHIDGFPGIGGKTGLDTLDGMVLEKNPASVNGLFFKDNVASTLVVSVRRGGVTLTMDGKVILNWQGNYNRLSQSPVYKAKDSRMMLVGAYESKYHITRMTLVPITGQGKRLR
jgi:hypothetical protein